MQGTTAKITFRFQWSGTK